MIELIQEAFWGVNLIATIPLLVVLVYWILVIVGFLGGDVLHFDGHVDLDADGHLDGATGLLKGLASLFHVGDVPIAIVGTLLSLFFWVTTMITHHYFNESHSWLIVAGLFIPNLIVSMVITRVALIPFARLFRNYDRTEFTRDELIGRIGIVTTLEVNEKSGQIELDQKGPPILLNVRAHPGARLGKGDAARIISFNQHSDTFLVELSKWEKH